MDIFWMLIFVIFAVQPVVKQRMLEAARLKLVRFSRFTRQHRA